MKCIPANNKYSNFESTIKLRTMKKLILLLCIPILALCSCFSYSKVFAKELDALVPAEFGAQTRTILVEKYDVNMINRAVKKSLEKNYNGEYLVVDKKSIDASYPDMDKYRYQFGVNEAYTSGAAGPDFRIFYHVYLIDRKTGQKYMRDAIIGSLVDNHLDAYLAKLEKARKK